MADNLCTNDLSSKSQKRFLFSPVEKNARLGLNRFYSPQLLNCRQIADFLDVSERAIKESLKKYRIFPAYYRKKSALFYVKDIIRLAKKLQREFLIPVGYFHKPGYIYVGKEVAGLSKIWHESRVKRYSSLFELFMEEGIPVTTIVIAPSEIAFLEPSFLTIAGKLFHRYNQFAEKSDLPRRHIYLCTRSGKRKEAQTLVARYNKRFPGFLISIDLDHLITLRNRFAQMNQCR